MATKTVFECEENSDYTLEMFIYKGNHLYVGIDVRHDEQCSQSVILTLEDAIKLKEQLSGLITELEAK